MLNLFQYLVLLFKNEILKQVQDDGSCVGMTVCTLGMRVMTTFCRGTFVVMLNLFQYLVLMFNNEILKQVQDDGMVFQDDGMLLQDYVMLLQIDGMLLRNVGSCYFL
jgi:hypothetical protein